MRRWSFEMHQLTRSGFTTSIQFSAVSSCVNNSRRRVFFQSLLALVSYPRLCWIFRQYLLTADARFVWVIISQPNKPASLFIRLVFDFLLICWTPLIFCNNWDCLVTITFINPTNTHWTFYLEKPHLTTSSHINVFKRFQTCGFILREGRARLIGKIKWH